MSRLRGLCLALLSLGTIGTRSLLADATVTACVKDVWPGDPRTDLSEALAAGGTITFACSGTIAFTRSHALTKNVTIDGGNTITLDGRGNRMFTMGNVFPFVVFKGIRIVGAAAGPSGLPGSVIVGEGNVALLDGTTISQSDKPIWVMAGSLTIQNAAFLQNNGPVAVVSEGSLDISRFARFDDNTGQTLATGPGTQTRIADTQFSGNGGSNFGGTAANGCQVTITNSQFFNNVSAEDGGAFTSRCKLTMEKVQFGQNRAARDGGAVFLGVHSDVTIRALTFNSNQAGRNGGAVADVAALGQEGALRIASSRFVSNQAGAAGGAIWTGEAGPVVIGGGSFVSNSAATGGGAVYIRQSPLDISRSLFFKNKSDNTGGAIESFCMPVNAGRITNTIIAGNSAGTGAAFFGSQTTFINTSIVSNGGRPVYHSNRCGDKSIVAFSNTIVEGGFTGGCAGADASRTFKDLGNNIQFPWWSCGGTIRSVPPVLGLSFAPLAPFSPAQGAGNTVVCEKSPISGRDIYGAHRPQGPTCSIGAVEGDLTTAYDRAAKGRIPKRR